VKTGAFVFMGMEHQVLIDIPLNILVERCKPFHKIPFGWNHQSAVPEWTEPITVEEVLVAIKEERFREDWISTDRMEHIERVAYLAHFGWDWRVTVRAYPGENKWEMIDGYHRLHAAIVRNETALAANLHNLCRWTLSSADREWIKKTFSTTYTP
jgi:hypothetical protein